MKVCFVDTNIFIEVLQRKGEKSDRALKLLESDATLWTTEMVIAEIEWVLRDLYELPRVKIADHLRRILSLSNLNVPHKGEIMEATLLYESIGVDWTDCFNAVIARDEGVNEVYSFDRDFNKFKFLKRLEP